MTRKGNHPMKYTYSQAAPTHSETAERLVRLRSEFIALHHKQNEDRMTDQDDARAADLRDQISVLTAHMGRLERFEAPPGAATIMAFSNGLVTVGTARLVCRCARLAGSVDSTPVV
jgi:hypothetical protein